MDKKIMIATSPQLSETLVPSLAPNVSTKDPGVLRPRCFKNNSGASTPPRPQSEVHFTLVEYITSDLHDSAVIALLKIGWYHSSDIVWYMLSCYCICQLHSHDTVVRSASRDHIYPHRSQCHMLQMFAFMVELSYTLRIEDHSKLMAHIPETLPRIFAN